MLYSVVCVCALDLCVYVLDPAVVFCCCSPPPPSPQKIPKSDKFISVMDVISLRKKRKGITKLCLLSMSCTDYAEALLSDREIFSHMLANGTCLYFLLPWQ